MNLDELAVYFTSVNTAHVEESEIVYQNLNEIDETSSAKFNIKTIDLKELRKCIEAPNANSVGPDNLSGGVVKLARSVCE